MWITTDVQKIGKNNGLNSHLIQFKLIRNI